MNNIVSIDSYKLNKMSVLDRIKYELEKNSNVLFGHKYFIIGEDGEEELNIISNISGKPIGYHIIYLQECNKILVKPDSITIVDEQDGVKVTLSKDGANY